MRTVHPGLWIGLFGQVALLAGLTDAVGLSPLGWLVGLGCGLVVSATLAYGLSRAPVRTLGPADRVTLTRVTLVGGIAALVADSFVRPAALPAIVTLAVIALALDAVDGWVARRTRTASDLGARFDMEVDAFLIFVLSTYVARSIGLWVLAIGIARYLFVAAGWLLPWLREAAPARYWCKVVAAIQGIVLTVAAAVLPTIVITALVAAAALLLAESFGRDVWWLARHRRVRAPRAVKTHRIAHVRAI